LGKSGENVLCAGLQKFAPTPQKEKIWVGGRGSEEKGEDVEKRGSQKRKVPTLQLHSAAIEGGPGKGLAKQPYAFMLGGRAKNV